MVSKPACFDRFNNLTFSFNSTELIHSPNNDPLHISSFLSNMMLSNFSSQFKSLNNTVFLIILQIPTFVTFPVLMMQLLHYPEYTFLLMYHSFILLFYSPNDQLYFMLIQLMLLFFIFTIILYTLSLGRTNLSNEDVPLY
jgi:hypothetical protein